jgi:hypothetical protein
MLMALRATSEDENVGFVVSRINACGHFRDKLAIVDRENRQFAKR